MHGRDVDVKERSAIIDVARVLHRHRGTRWDEAQNSGFIRRAMASRDFSHKFHLAALPV